MTGVDWIIVAFVTLLALFGYGQGFLVGALSLIGFAPRGLPRVSHRARSCCRRGRNHHMRLFSRSGARSLSAGLLALALETVGRALRSGLVLPGLGFLDGVLGAVLSATVGLGLAWVFGAVALQTPGARELRRDVQRSTILSALYDAFPPADVLNLLARFDPFPQISGPVAGRLAAGPADRLGPGGAPRGGSVVRITGTACGLGVEGSGWVAGPGRGGDERARRRGPGRHRRAGRRGRARRSTPTRWRTTRATTSRCCASTGSTRRRSTSSASPEPGTSGAILGFPENGPYDVRAARIGADDRRPLARTRTAAARSRGR